MPTLTQTRPQTLFVAGSSLALPLPVQERHRGEVASCLDQALEDEDLVNDMDDALAGLYVSGHHLGISVTSDASMNTLLLTR
jgi:hypothetical protein